MQKLILVRHGESEWNRENRFTGWTDVPLSEKGVQEARASFLALVPPVERVAIIDVRCEWCILELEMAASSTCTPDQRCKSCLREAYLIGRAEAEGLPRAQRPRQVAGESQVTK